MGLRNGSNSPNDYGDRQGGPDLEDQRQVILSEVSEPTGPLPDGAYNPGDPADLPEQVRDAIRSPDVDAADDLVVEMWDDYATLVGSQYVDPDIAEAVFSRVRAVTTPAGESLLPEDAHSITGYDTAVEGDAELVSHFSEQAPATAYVHETWHQFHGAFGWTADPTFENDLPGADTPAEAEQVFEAMDESFERAIDHDGAVEEVVPKAGDQGAESALTDAGEFGAHFHAVMQQESNTRPANWFFEHGDTARAYCDVFEPSAETRELANHLHQEFPAESPWESQPFPDAQAAGSVEQWEARMERLHPTVARSTD